MGCGHGCGTSAAAFQTTSRSVGREAHWPLRRRPFASVPDPAAARAKSQDAEGDVHAPARRRRSVTPKARHHFATGLGTTQSFVARLIDRPLRGRRPFAWGTLEGDTPTQKLADFPPGNLRRCRKLADFCCDLRRTPKTYPKLLHGVFRGPEPARTSAWPNPARGDATARVCHA